MFEFTINAMPFVMMFLCFSVVVGAVVTLIKGSRDEKKYLEQLAEMNKKDKDFVPFWLK